MRTTGTYQKSGDLDYFIPHSLPPKDPDFELSPELMSLYGETTFAFGQLNEMSERLPDPERFIKAYIMKEALLSSEIEGIHTTLIEVFTQPLSGSRPTKDTQLVMNYSKALNESLKMLQVDGLPVTSRIILKAHEVLLKAGEGDKSSPGNYRKQSVQVGKLIPPPSQEIPSLMGALERFINESSKLPSLIKIGLTHVQFETIHPFLDGNGRIGRLLIVLMLIDSGLLKLPILYPSFYMKKHQLEYYQKLDAVRISGDFEGWIHYFLTSLRDSTQDAYERAKKIEILEKDYFHIIYNSQEFQKTQETAILALSYLFTQPVTTITEMSQSLSKSFNTISSILKHFTQLSWTEERAINKKSKGYRFSAYLELLE